MSVMDTVMAFLQSLQGAPAYALLFGLLFASGFGLPVNEDILLLAAAALTLRNVMDPLPLIAVAWFGLLAADTLVFHWGRAFGARLLRHRLFASWLPEARLAAMQNTMLRYGPGYIFLVRFMPGMRTALFFAAGSLRMPYRYMPLFDGAAALVELPLLVYGVRYVGGNWEQILAQFQRFQVFAVPALVVLVVLGMWLYKRRGSSR